MNIDIDEMRKNMITFKPIPLEECLDKHRKDGYCAVFRNISGKPGHYDVECFACGVSRNIMIKPTDPPKNGST